MRRMSHLVPAILLGVAAPLAAQQQGDFLRPREDQATTRVANRGFNFLEIGVGARGQAMAGALTGLAQGAEAMYWNPAGIASTEGLVAAFSYAALYSDLNIDHAYAGVMMPFASGGLGLSYLRLSSGDILRTTEDRPDGADPQFGQNFDWVAQSIGLSYGRRLTDRLQVGITAKAIREGMDDASASSWAVDLGTQFSTGLYGLTLGAALTNIGPAAKLDGPAVSRRIEAPEAFGLDVPVTFSVIEYEPPTAFRFSVVENLAGGADALLSAGGDHSLKAALDLVDGVDTDLQTAIGLEYSFRQIAYVRGGKRWVNEGSEIQTARDFGHALSVGGGIRLPFLGRHVAFDYAYTGMNELQNVQVFSFEFGF